MQTSDSTSSPMKKKKRPSTGSISYVSKIDTVRFYALTKRATKLQVEAWQEQAGGATPGQIVDRLTNHATVTEWKPMP